MLPISLVQALNRFYQARHPFVRQLSAPASVEIEQGSRPPSAVDAFLLLHHTDEIGPEAREYVDFFATMATRFREVEAWYDINVRATGEGEHEAAKSKSAGWGGCFAMPLAAMLYSVVKDGTPGDYVECGVFKGGSLACMSHVCDYLGISAIAGDTFEGLPWGDESGFYHKGQYQGELDEVRSYITKVGRPDSVIWKKGLFSETLPSLANRVALAFLDTDLYESSVSALGVLKLSPGTVIASDGVGWSDFIDGDFQPWSAEGKAVQDSVARGPLLGLWTGNGHMSLFKQRVVGDRLFYSTAFMHYLTHRFYFPELYSRIVVSSRRDAGRVLGRSDATEAELLDFALSEIMEQQYQLSYTIGGLRWQLNELSG